MKTSHEQRNQMNNENIIKCISVETFADLMLEFTKRGLTFKAHASPGLFIITLTGGY